LKPQKYFNFSKNKGKAKMNKPVKKRFLERMRQKYRFVVLTDKLEEKGSFSLSRVNVLFSISLILLLVTAAVFFLIAKTSLREYIPGYADFDTRQEFANNAMLVDSLEKAIELQYEKNIALMNVLSGDIDEYTKDHYRQKDTISVIQHGKTPEKSEKDSLLRAEFEKEESFNVVFDDESVIDQSIKNILFFPPVRGVITERFHSEHPAVDIASSPKVGIKAVLEGTVVYSGWNVSTGYSIVIQHKKNLISVYKHNSILLKKIGNFVHAGETIAIIGESGELSQGPHLHFELWYDGYAVDPEKYIAF
jgi:murein DD-endopeptidase MepM/ murein hydrolase activator NlpD